MHPNRLLTTLQGHLTDDAILVCDGGDALSFDRVALSASTYLDCGSFGCLGIGLPYGIAAGLAYPERQVVVVTGDGSFGFNAMEIDTAVRHKAPLLIVILNNGAWQIEVHDQKENYHRVVGTQLQFSDYAAMARAFGMYAERVERAEDLDAAIQRALAAGTALLDVVVTPEAVSSDAKLGLAFGFDLQILRTWDEEERAWRNEESEN
jgi:acetolactate synthase-1/2/3 large subunit